RDVHRAPLRAGPRLRDAHPARALLVLLPLAVPEELHLHAPVLVDVDLLALGTDDDRGLRAVDPRRRRLQPRTELHLRVDQRVAAGDLRPRTRTARMVGAGVELVVSGDHQVLLVLIVAREVGEREQPPRAQPSRVAPRLDDLEVDLLLLEPDLDARIPELR